MNKHGFVGVRKRTDGRLRPYYARLTVRGEYIYTSSHETPEAASKEFQWYATAIRLDIGALKAPKSNRSVICACNPANVRTDLLLHVPQRLSPPD